MIFSKRKNVRCLSYIIDLDLSSYCFGWFRTILTEVLDFIHAVFQIKEEKKNKKKNTYLNEYTNDCCQYREENDDEKIESQTMIQCFGQIKIANI